MIVFTPKVDGYVPNRQSRRSCKPGRSNLGGQIRDIKSVNQGYQGSVNQGYQIWASGTSNLGVHRLLPSVANDVPEDVLHFFFFVTLEPRVEGYTKSMSLKYEPASEPLHIYVK